MIKKKYIVIGFLVFCLTATLLVSVTSSAEYNPWADITGDGNVNIWDLGALSDAWLTSGIPIPRDGYISICAASFVPANNTQETHLGIEVLQNGDSTDTLKAGCSVQFPHGATVTNFTSYWFDGGDQNIKCRLFRYKMETTNMMASADSSGSAGVGSSLDWSIEHHTVDNSQYAYYVLVELPAWPGWPGYWFTYVIIGYEYS